jgi:hypothetical protein
MAWLVLRELLERLRLEEPYLLGHGKFHHGLSLVESKLGKKRVRKA